jgi:cell division protein FtsL
MTQREIEKRRKLFFVCISILATAITLVSASATYTINKASFADWKELEEILAICATAGIEATFAVTLYGVTYALTGQTEKRIGYLLLAGTIAVMATNYVIHHKLITHSRLSEWQTDYIQGVGPLSLFVILLLIVGIIIFNHDAKKRLLDREYAFAAERRVMEWRQQQLDSAAFDEHMAQYQPQVFEEARKSLSLTVVAPSQPVEGFGRGSNDPKGQERGE